MTKTINMPHLHDYHHPPLNGIEITYSEIISSIEKIQLSSSTGDYKIRSKLLKNTNSNSAHFLLSFSNLYLLASFQLTANLAESFLFYTSGNCTSPYNYRPISLTSVTCTLLEHIIFSDVIKHIENNHLLFPYQHEFSQSFPGETRLVQLANETHSNIDGIIQTHARFIEFFNAFRRISYTLYCLN